MSDVHKKLKSTARDSSQEEGPGTVAAEEISNLKSSGVPSCTIDGLHSGSSSLPGLATSAVTPRILGRGKRSLEGKDSGCEKKRRVFRVAEETGSKSSSNPTLIDLRSPEKTCKKVRTTGTESAGFCPEIYDLEEGEVPPSPTRVGSPTSQPTSLNVTPPTICIKDDGVDLLQLKISALEQQVFSLRQANEKLLKAKKVSDSQGILYKQEIEILKQKLLISQKESTITEKKHSLLEAALQSEREKEAASEKTIECLESKLQCVNQHLSDAASRNEKLKLKIANQRLNLNGLSNLLLKLKRIPSSSFEKEVEAELFNYRQCTQQSHCQCKIAVMALELEVGNLLGQIKNPTQLANLRDDLEKTRNKPSHSSNNEAGKMKTKKPTTVSKSPGNNTDRKAALLFEKKVFKVISDNFVMSKSIMQHFEDTAYTLPTLRPCFRATLAAMPPATRSLCMGKLLTLLPRPSDVLSPFPTKWYDEPGLKGNDAARMAVFWGHQTAKHLITMAPQVGGDPTTLTPVSIWSCPPPTTALQPQAAAVGSGKHPGSSRPSLDENANVTVMGPPRPAAKKRVASTGASPARPQQLAMKEEPREVVATAAPLPASVCPRPSCPPVSQGKALRLAVKVEPGEAGVSGPLPASAVTEPQARDVTASAVSEQTTSARGSPARLPSAEVKPPSRLGEQRLFTEKAHQVAGSETVANTPISISSMSEQQTRGRDAPPAPVSTLLGQLIPGAPSAPVSTLLEQLIPGATISTPVSTLLEQLVTGATTSTPVSALLERLIPGAPACAPVSTLLKRLIPGAPTSTPVSTILERLLSCPPPPPPPPKAVNQRASDSLESLPGSGPKERLPHYMPASTEVSPVEAQQQGVKAEPGLPESQALTVQMEPQLPSALEPRRPASPVIPPVEEQRQAIKAEPGLLESRAPLVQMELQVPSAPSPPRISNTEVSTAEAQQRTLKTEPEQQFPSAPTPLRPASTVLPPVEAQQQGVKAKPVLPDSLAPLLQMEPQLPSALEPRRPVSPVIPPVEEQRHAIKAEPGLPESQAPSVQMELQVPSAPTPPRISSTQIPPVETQQVKAEPTSPTSPRPGPSIATASVAPPVVSTRVAPTLIPPKTEVPAPIAPTVVAPTTVVPAHMAPAPMAPAPMAPAPMAPAPMAPAPMAPAPMAPAPMAPAPMAPACIGSVSEKTVQTVSSTSTTSGRPASCDQSVAAVAGTGAIATSQEAEQRSSVLAHGQASVEDTRALAGAEVLLGARSFAGGARTAPRFIHSMFESTPNTSSASACWTSAGIRTAPSSTMVSYPSYLYEGMKYKGTSATQSTRSNMLPNEGYYGCQLPPNERYYGCQLPPQMIQTEQQSSVVASQSPPSPRPKRISFSVKELKKRINSHLKPSS